MYIGSGLETLIYIQKKQDQNNLATNHKMGLALKSTPFIRVRFLIYLIILYNTGTEILCLHGVSLQTISVSIQIRLNT